MSTVSKKIIEYLLKHPPQTNDDISMAERLILRTIKTDKIPTKADLLKAYHKLLKYGKIKQSKNLETILIKRGVRTLSGVAIVTVLTKPFPCPGKCIYCPDEARMPKSYISDEPAAARALKLKFDPYEQVYRRIATLKANGHPTDKIELIVKGGTWNFYPVDYQYWFILRCFEAANKQIKKLKIKNQNYHSKLKIEKIKNQLKLKQRKNETAKHRIIGLTLETRPDWVNTKNVQVMRDLGCTRIEMGVQTTDDKILKNIQRGHNIETVKIATEILKNYGFKVDYHLMPQLPGSTPAKDLAMMKEIFSNPDFRPDMIKIYPCTVIENTKLHQWLKQKKYKPYSDKQLIETIIKFKTAIPYYARVSRLIRDIPAHHIKGGNTMTNLRQVIQSEMTKRGLKCNCLRCREVGHQKNLKLKNQKLKMFVDKYTASNGTEYFLSFCAPGASASGGEDTNRQVVYAFCRLRICHCEQNEMKRSNLHDIRLPRRSAPRNDRGGWHGNKRNGGSDWD